MKYGLSNEVYNKIKEIVKNIIIMNLEYLVQEQEATIR